jgi:plastocyanin
VRATKLLSLVAAALTVAACAAGPAGTVEPGAASAGPTPSAVVEAPPSTSPDRPGPSLTTESPQPSPSASAVPGRDDPADVIIEGFAFNPERVQARAGQRIQWSNRDGEPHTVRSEDGEFASAIIVGEPFEWTVTGTPGTEIEYACGIHPAMTGTVVIDD